MKPDPSFDSHRCLLTKPHPQVHARRPQPTHPISPGPRRPPGTATRHSAPNTTSSPGAALLCWVQGSGRDKSLAMTCGRNEQANRVLQRVGSPARPPRIAGRSRRRGDRDRCRAGEYVEIEFFADGSAEIEPFLTQGVELPRTLISSGSWSLSAHRTRPPPLASRWARGPKPPQRLRHLLPQCHESPAASHPDSRRSSLLLRPGRMMKRQSGARSRSGDDPAVAPARDQAAAGGVESSRVRWAGYVDRDGCK